MSRLLLALLLTSTSIFAFAEDEYLCLEKSTSASESLADQAQKIISKTDPEANDFCAGLIPKTDAEMQGRSVEEVLENYAIRGHYSEDTPLVQTKEEYCSSNPLDMIRKFCVLKGKLGHDNNGGILGLPTGVCWWNSRFHRKVNYLTYMNPKEKSDYSDNEFEAIIKKIGKYQVTPINGYSSFNDFVNDSKHPNRNKILQKYLQKEMGKSTLGFDWIKGFIGKANVEKNHDTNSKQIDRQRKKQIQEISKIKKELVDDKKVSFVVVQQPGVPAHSFLVYDMTQLVDSKGNKAFKIKVQDSAYQFNTAFVENDYVFDTKTGQWFSEQSYKKLADNRKKGIEPKIVVDHSGWHSNTLNQDLQKPDVVGSLEWTLWNYRNNEMDQINEAFSEECGHSLFK